MPSYYGLMWKFARKQENIFFSSPVSTPLHPLSKHCFKGLLPLYILLKLIYWELFEDALENHKNPMNNLESYYWLSSDSWLLEGRTVLNIVWHKDFFAKDGSLLGFLSGNRHNSNEMKTFLWLFTIPSARGSLEHTGPSGWRHLELV